MIWFKAFIYFNLKWRNEWEKYLQKG